MPGSFMQLAAFGLQDLYLVEEPQMTYWKNIYFQHTNFSMIDKPDFNIKTSANGTKLYMYALNYNVLKIQDGMGGLVHTN